jgi:hypothetical protein
VVSTDWGCQMTKLYAFVLVPLVLTVTVVTAWGQTSGGPETVVVHSGSATLHAMLWAPEGPRPVPRHPAESRQRPYP